MTTTELNTIDDMLAYDAQVNQYSPADMVAEPAPGFSPEMIKAHNIVASDWDQYDADMAAANILEEEVEEHECCHHNNACCDRTCCFCGEVKERDWV